ncbi:MAG: D-alanyl-D-alanine carboxypeptidase [Ruminococcus sp.]|nr:D-alanyl-D-alanine carboxypeptidase [Ruminococcus sp.]
MFKHIVSYALILSILIMPVSVLAKADKPKLDLNAPSAVLMEAETGKILLEKNKDDRRACASITKVMTLLLVMEAVERGQLKLSDTLTTSEHASSMGGSDIWLEPGEKMKVDDLIKATAVASANDAAVVLAEAISGSEDVFVNEMNKRAKALGMKNTTFKNCNGLDEKGHLTSSNDVAIMSRELIKHKKIFDYTSIWIDELRAGKTQIVNTNKLLKSYDGITGLKTGTTGDAGCCITATAERGGLSLIAVVLGGKSGKERFKDAADLLDYGFANYTVKKLTLPKAATQPVKVEGGMTDTLKLVCRNPGNTVIGKTASERLSSECKIKKDIKAPVDKGDRVGEVNYYLNGEIIKSCPITAGNSVDEMCFGTVLSGIFNSLLEL